VLAGLVAPLTACSVPRDADLTAASPGGRAADVTSGPPRPSPSPVVERAVSNAAAAPSPSVSPIPSPSPRPQPVRKPTPVAVAGYSLSAPPGSVANPLAGIKGATEVFGALTVRSVTKGGAPVGLLFLFAVRPEYTSDPSVASVVLAQITAAITRGGAPVTMQRFGRQEVGVASSAASGTIVVWLANGVLAVVVGGSDPSLVTGYARAYIAAS
jgi:hypothetical protein